MFCKIDPAVDEGHALVLQQRYLLVHTAEGESRRRLAEAVDYAKARDGIGIGIYMKGISHHAAPSRIARQAFEMIYRIILSQI